MKKRPWLLKVAKGLLMCFKTRAHCIGIRVPSMCINHILRRDDEHKDRAVAVKAISSLIICYAVIGKASSFHNFINFFNYSGAFSFERSAIKRMCRMYLLSNVLCKRLPQRPCLWGLRPLQLFLQITAAKQ